MARHLAWLVALVLLAPATGSGAAVCERDRDGAFWAQQRGGPPSPGNHRDGKPDDKAPDRGRPKWWIDAKLRAELGVTDQQSAAVEAIWQKSFPPLVEGRQKLEKLEDTLSQMTDVADEASVVAQIDRVENLRADLSKGRTLMIYRMNKVLTSEQRAKVKAMYERRDAGRRGPPSKQ